MYDKFRTINDAKNAYKRRRTSQTFILEGDEKELANTKCCKCGRALNDYTDIPQGYQSNRCDYMPKSKTVRPMHYTCAWGQTLSEVAKIEH